jgi:hypothetical protein
MADSKIQMQIEEWIRENWLPEKFHQSFTALTMGEETGDWEPLVMSLRQAEKFQASSAYKVPVKWECQAP